MAIVEPEMMMMMMMMMMMVMVSTICFIHHFHFRHRHSRRVSSAIIQAGRGPCITSSAADVIVFQCRIDFGGGHGTVRSGSEAQDQGNYACDVVRGALQDDDAAPVQAIAYRGALLCWQRP